MLWQFCSEGESLGRDKKKKKRPEHFPLKSWLDKRVFLRIISELEKIIVRFLLFTCQILISYDNLQTS